jgi:hypothetical protein
MTQPSAFVDSPEDLLVKTESWLEEVADSGTPVSAIRVLDRVRPLCALLRQERSNRSTAARLLTEQNVEIGQLSNDLEVAMAKGLEASAALARPSVKFGLWLGRMLSFFVKGRA